MGTAQVALVVSHIIVTVMWTTSSTAIMSLSYPEKGLQFEEFLPLNGIEGYGSDDYQEIVSGREKSSDISPSVEQDSSSESQNCAEFDHLVEQLEVLHADSDFVAALRKAHINHNDTTTNHEALREVLYHPAVKTLQGNFLSKARKSSRRASPNFLIAVMRALVRNLGQTVSRRTTRRPFQYVFNSVTATAKKPTITTSSSFLENRNVKTTIEPMLMEEEKNDLVEGKSLVTTERIVRITTFFGSKTSSITETSQTIRETTEPLPTFEKAVNEREEVTRLTTDDLRATLASFPAEDSRSSTEKIAVITSKAQKGSTLIQRVVMKMNFKPTTSRSTQAHQNTVEHTVNSVEKSEFPSTPAAKISFNNSLPWTDIFKVYDAKATNEVSSTESSPLFHKDMTKTILESTKIRPFGDSFGNYAKHTDQVMEEEQGFSSTPLVISNSNTGTQNSNQREDFTAKITKQTTPTESSTMAKQDSKRSSKNSYDINTEETPSFSYFADTGEGFSSTPIVEIASNAIIQETKRKPEVSEGKIKEAASTSTTGSSTTANHGAMKVRFKLTTRSTNDEYSKNNAAHTEQFTDSPQDNAELSLTTVLENISKMVPKMTEKPEIFQQRTPERTTSSQGSTMIQKIAMNMKFQPTSTSFSNNPNGGIGHETLRSTDSIEITDISSTTVTELLPSNNETRTENKPEVFYTNISEHRTISTQEASFDQEDPNSATNTRIPGETTFFHVRLGMAPNSHKKSSSEEVVGISTNLTSVSQVIDNMNNDASMTSSNFNGRFFSNGLGIPLEEDPTTSRKIRATTYVPLPFQTYRNSTKKSIQVVNFIRETNPSITTPRPQRRKTNGFFTYTPTDSTKFSSPKFDFREKTTVKPGSLAQPQGPPVPKNPFQFLDYRRNRFREYFYSTLGPTLATFPGSYHHNHYQPYHQRLPVHNRYEYLFDRHPDRVKPVHHPQEFPMPFGPGMNYRITEMGKPQHQYLRTSNTEYFDTLLTRKKRPSVDLAFLINDRDSSMKLRKPSSGEFSNDILMDNFNPFEPPRKMIIPSLMTPKLVNPLSRLPNVFLESFLKNSHKAGR